MTTSDPLTCLIIALAYYTGLSPDGDEVKKMARVIFDMAPHLPEVLQSGHHRLCLELENGKLRRVEPAQSYLIRE